MKQRRLLRFHGLQRIRIRQTWNKYNLFNLLRMRTPRMMPKTFFQQKWIGKSLTRGYHGEHIKEYQWERMFKRRALSAVDMSPTYMARYDGSEQATGRGSGRRDAIGELQGPRNKANRRDQTPYMQMVFAPMERRLDIAIFRALFASSARQARQFVLHGAVTVNGKKMRHPSYLLNPGDMFQVDVDRVMLAAGKPKVPNKNQKALPTTAATEEPEADEAEAEAEEGAAATEAAEALEGEAAEAAKDKHKETLKELKDRAQKFMLTKSVHFRAKQKIALRQALADVKKAIDDARKPGTSSVSEMDKVEAELSGLLNRLTLSPAQRKVENKKNKEVTKKSKAAGEPKPERALTFDQARLFRWLMREEYENPHDPSKPYATPWKPRDWMSPFAFVPRYLEVNQNICAAVYLRHPVARPGISEVPTPFSPTLSQLAFNWYLRRG